MRADERVDVGQGQFGRIRYIEFKSLVQPEGWACHRVSFGAMRTRSIIVTTAAAGTAFILTACGGGGRPVAKSTGTQASTGTTITTSSGTTDPNAGVIANAQASGARLSTLNARLRSQLHAVPDPTVPDDETSLIMQAQGEPNTMCGQATSEGSQDVPCNSCQLLLLVGSQQVATYKSAGDPVVVNPSDTLGVKVVCDTSVEAQNLTAVAQVLKTL